MYCVARSLNQRRARCIAVVSAGINIAAVARIDIAAAAAHDASQLYRMRLNVRCCPLWGGVVRREPLV